MRRPTRKRDAEKSQRSAITTTTGAAAKRIDVGNHPESAVMTVTPRMAVRIAIAETIALIGMRGGETEMTGMAEMTATAGRIATARRIVTARRIA